MVGIVNDLAGRRLGQYQLRQVIRRGGMSTVYLGYQPSLDRLVAVKVLAFPGDPEFAARFEREARSIAALQHPNILAVYDYGEEEDQAYLVVQYVEDGRTLVDLLREPQPPLRCLELLERVLAGLGYAHERGIVHRDVKPSNILMASPDWPMLADFGIAKLLLESDREPITRQGFIVGTAAYMAPEQGFGLPVDARTDLYSAGVVLFEMLTGRVPFKADTPMAAMVAAAYEPPPPLKELNPQLPGELEAVVLRALAKDPAERYQSADEMAAALRTVRGELQQPAASDFVPPPARNGTNGPGLGQAPVKEPSQRRSQGRGRAPVTPNASSTRRPPVASSPPPVRRREWSDQEMVTPPSRPVPVPVPAPEAGALRQPSQIVVWKPLPAPSPPGAAPSSSRGRRRLAVALLAIVALAAGALWGLNHWQQSKVQRILLIGMADPGPAPFVGSASASSRTQPIFSSPHPLQIIKQRGTQSKLYGGNRNMNPQGCDRSQLIMALQNDPSRAAAWREALNRDPALYWSDRGTVNTSVHDSSQIATLVNDLTPVALLTDTRFIDVGFKDGRAVSYQSVLQRGTGVLIDRRGMPRLRCQSGDPLLQAAATVERYLGQRWPGFSLSAVDAIQPGSSPVTSFTLLDLSNPSRSFTRPAGIVGPHDSLTTQ